MTPPTWKGELSMQSDNKTENWRFPGFKFTNTTLEMVRDKGPFGQVLLGMPQSSSAFSGLSELTYTFVIIQTGI